MSAAVHSRAFMVVVVGLTVPIFRAIALRIGSVSPDIPGILPAF